MIRRYSSRRASLHKSFLQLRLQGATRYDRIAGYFQSSLLELANRELAAISQVRIVCNTDINPDDLRTVRMATGVRRNELEEELLRMVWNGGQFPHMVDVHGAPAQRRFQLLYEMLVSSGKNGRLFEIRVIPDAEFGFVHGKGGVISGPTGTTSFVGSANDSANAWTRNYELVWEDESPESVAWMQRR